MRSWWLVVVVAGCYAPRVAPGAPCDLAIDNCPTGQVCTAGAGGATCELAGGPEHDGAPADADVFDARDAPVDARSDARPDGRPDAPPDAPPVHLDYLATVAECVNRNAPNPAACTNANGSAQLVADNLDSITGNPWDGFVRFDLDTALAGKTVTSVTLRMTATSNDKAPSPSSGVVWQVQQFTKQSLLGAEPSRVGGQPIAPAQGAVIKLQVVEWPLPASLVSSGGSVYLSIVNGASDGVNYWNLTGTNPPRLLIDAQ